MNPTQLFDLIGAWKTDATIDRVAPELELLKIPNLHAKYSSEVVLHTIAKHAKEKQLATLTQIKTMYFTGKLNNPDDLKKYGWEPFPYILKSGDVSVHLQADKDINEIVDKILIHSQAIEFCKSIVQQLGNRTYQINGHLSYGKYKLGI